MLSPKITVLLQAIEQLPQDQQESIADALAVELADATQPQPTLADLLAEARADITHGRTTPLEVWLAENDKA
jgi:hypothetical protein